MHQSGLLSLSYGSPEHDFGSKKLPKASQGKPNLMTSMIIDHKIKEKEKERKNEKCMPAKGTKPTTFYL